ncbi:hypothetical protein VTJ83DRAFT_84 [Remersonia thermophila]|uniref:CUE domain-containing protein n=1 Tax=Remersonia thermophila TaxID=72144 RepID=A0ABR4DK21_9PEZI
MTTLPSFALFPIAAWRDQVPPDEWVACLNAWLALIASHLSLPESDFAALSARDESLQAFLVSFTREVASGGANILGPSPSARRLLRDCYALITKLLRSSSPPPDLARWEFLADAGRVYGKKKAGALVSALSAASKQSLDASLSALKKFLVKNLDAGLSGGDLKGVEGRLERVNDLISVSPPVAEFFLAGSDFVDGLIGCYKITNPPLRRVLIATTYLCLVGLAEDQKMSALTDHLYSLQAAADAHRSGPLNVNDSLVAELVTSTPLLRRLQRQLSESPNPSTRTQSVLASLESFRKPGGSTLPKPKRLVKRKLDKGKGLAAFDAGQEQHEVQVHRMSQISQVQDLFPDLGAGFVARLLDEYDGSAEVVIAHLLDDSLPPHLKSANRSEPLTQPSSSSSSQPQAAEGGRRRKSSLVPRPTPPLSASPGVGSDADDDDELAMLTSSRLHIGKRPGDADALLRNRAAAPSKAAILSALAAFDSDDDERDDTYDAADVGGAVDVALTEADKLARTEGPGAAAAAASGTAMPDEAEAALVRAYLARPETFARDAAVRQSAERARLRGETGLTDEAVEGWAVMLQRDEKRKRKLLARHGEFTGEQVEIERTSWRAGADEDGLDEDDDNGGEGASDASRGGGSFGRGRGGRGGGGGGPGRGRGRGRGGSAPPPADSDLARRRKEANKASRANHNRREGRARKLARAGFAG